MADNVKAKKAESKTKMTTDTVRLSYVHVWEPSSMKGDEKGKKKYSVSVIVPKSNTKLVERINGCVNAAVEDGVKALWKGKRPINLKLPLRDGDLERKDDPAYANSWFFNASSTTQPGIVDVNREEIVNQSEVYSGCYGRVIVNFYPYDVSSKGVAAGLNHVQKVKDGEPLAGRGNAADEFDDGIDLEDEMLK